MHQKNPRAFDGYLVTLAGQYFAKKDARNTVKDDSVDYVGDYVDKVRDKILPNRKKEDSKANTINFIERNKKFR